jgi:hypothetical protein
VKPGVKHPSQVFALTSSFSCAAIGGAPGAGICRKALVNVIANLTKDKIIDKAARAGRRARKP